MHRQAYGSTNRFPRHNGRKRLKTLGINNWIFRERIIRGLCGGTAMLRNATLRTLPVSTGSRVMEERFGLGLQQNPESIERERGADGNVE